MESRGDAIERQERLRDFMMDYWLNLQADRRENITQNQLAAHLGWSVNVMSRVMRASGLPSLENTIQAAKVVGPQIFAITGYPRLAYEDPDFEVIMEEWPKLSEEERKKLISNLWEIRKNEGERAHAPNARPVAAEA